MVIGISPDRNCHCFWWRSKDREGQVFPSRSALDLYDSALALANSLALEAESSTTESAVAADRNQSLDELVSTAAWFLVRSASLPELDPCLDLVHLNCKKSPRRKRRFSAADLPFPSIAQELSSAFPPRVSSSPFPSSFSLAGDNEDKDHRGFPALPSPIECTCGRSSAEVWRVWVAERPFLCRFTHGCSLLAPSLSSPLSPPPSPEANRWVLARMVHDGVVALEKQKRYIQASACLRLLLSTPFCPGKRGHWWNRLSLNTEHLRCKKRALILAEAALQDRAGELRLCDQLALQKRVLKLAKPPLRWTKPAFLLTPPTPHALSIAHLKKPRTNTIYGELLRENVCTSTLLPDLLLITQRVGCRPRRGGSQLLWDTTESPVVWRSSHCSTMPSPKEAGGRACTPRLASSRPSLASSCGTFCSQRCLGCFSALFRVRLCFPSNGKGLIRVAELAFQLHHSTSARMPFVSAGQTFSKQG